MVIDVYRREWTPGSEQQLARKINDKGGVKYVENSDTILSELAGLDNSGSVEKVRSRCVKICSASN